MTTQEFSAEFDVLYNNITSNQAPGLNEYEKSVFLTKAQSLLINEYFNNRTDGVGGGFDGSQRRLYDFSSIIKTRDLVADNNTVTSKVDSRSVVYLFPADYFLSVNEIIRDNKYQYSVLPISYEEYQRLMLKPYNFPVKRAVWRLFTTRVLNTEESPTVEPINFNWKDLGVILKATTSDTTVTHLIVKLSGSTGVTRSETDGVVTITIGTTTFDGYTTWQQMCAALNDISDTDINFEVVSAPDTKSTSSSTGEIIYSGDFIKNTRGFCSVAEVIGKFDKTTANYALRYIKKPAPIILDDISNYGLDLTIDGCTVTSQCELPEETHQEILERAVTLAKIAWQGGTATQAASASKQNNDD